MKFPAPVAADYLCSQWQMTQPCSLISQSRFESKQIGRLFLHVGFGLVEVITQDVVPQRIEKIKKA
jgi:hypothetical protein